MTPHVEIRRSEDGQVYVVTVGGNGEDLSSSETLTTVGAARNNIDAQREAFASGDVREMTE
jgi:hypothetical protein